MKLHDGTKDALAWIFDPRKGPKMSSTSHFRFFDLPAELRTSILSYLMISNDGVFLHNCTLFGRTPLGRVTVLHTFLVSIQMYQEASAIFYGQNRFTLNCQSHRLPAHLTNPGGFLSLQGEDARRRVHSLSLYLTRVGGEFENILAPAIADMILSGSLRNLKICLGQPNLHPGTSGPDINMMARLPFQALLSLLADPDLQHVGLFVWKAHWPVYCPFHRDLTLTNNGRPSTETVDANGLATIRGAPDWIQLDWEKMVELVGNCERIVKIEETDD
ncbi:hypothetical protein F4808DRAFT_450597 [Astrocystis sublimbata]|nr:hypothetical protein F4808DRAFT_450597 [Astrocystis sublimbata]